MESPGFLQTKLHPTQLATRSLHRNRLIRELNRESDARVVLITGPAGSGKSTLMADFIAQRVRRTAWLGLGEEDLDPHVFYSYFLESLCQAYPGSCEATRNRLSSYDLTAPQPLCLSLINEIFAFAEPVSILLDDYHLVHSNASIREFFQILCKRGPSNLTLYLVSRDVPDLPIPWLRSKRLLSEMHYAGLRFTWEETDQLLREIWGLNLDSELVQIILDRTEGWATAIQLVAQTIRGKPPESVRSIVEELSGDEETIYNYLACEVIQSQSQLVQEFLKLTAVPDSFNASLAGELVRGVDVTEMLHYLEKSRLFLIKLDKPGGWYRYHHLFRDFLRRKYALEQGQKALESTHHQLAGWFYHRQEVVAAIPHYLASGDSKSACQILESVGSELLHRGLKSSLAGWLEALPKSLQLRPGLQVVQCELFDLQGHWPKAVEGYRKALAEFRRLGDESAVAMTLEKLSICYIKYGEAKQLLESCEEGLRLCPPDQIAQKSMLQCWLGSTLVNSGSDWSRGYDLIRSGHLLAYQSGEPRPISWAALTYGFGFHLPQGNFTEALRTLNEGIDLFTRLEWVMVLYQLVMNKAVALIVMGLPEPARELIDDSLIQAHRAGHTYVEKGLEVLRAMAYLESRQLEYCGDTLDKISQTEIPAQFKPFFFRNRMVHNCLTQNFDQARVDADEMGRALQLNGSGIYAPECMVSYAFFLATTNDFPEALRRLEANLRLCETARAKFWEMKTLQVTAWVHWQTSAWEDTLQAVGDSLRLARSNGYDDYWLTDPWDLSVRLLLVAVAGQLEVEYAQRLLLLLNDRLMPALEELCQDPDIRVRRVATDYLSRQPVASSQVLLRSLYDSDGDEEVRAIARRALRLTEGLQLEVRCLGKLRLYRAGQELDYTSLLRPLGLRLLKFFLVHSSKMIPSELIMEAFWPELDEERGRKNLKTQLSLLRRQLGAPALFQRSGDACRIGGAGEVRLDLDEFEQTAQEGLELAKGSDRAAALATLEKAQLLYRGDLLEEDLYEEWIEQKRNQIKQLHERLLECLADLYMQQRNYEQAIQAYRRLLAGEEPREHVFPKILSCYEALGDRQSVRKEFESLRIRLLDSLGVEPQPSTRALVDAFFLPN